MRRIALLLALVATARLAVAQEPRGMVPADQFALQDVGEIRIAPDSSLVVFSVTTTDVKSNRSSTQWMKVPVNGGAPAALEGMPAGANTVRWSPNSKKLAFFASHEGRLALFVYDVASAQATRVCDYDRTNSFISKAGNWLAWSPDSSRLAFAGTLERVSRSFDPYVTPRLQYKTRTSLSDDRRTHIYVVSPGLGAPAAVTSGDFDEHSIDWGGDGSEIVFLSNRAEDPDVNHNYDIYAVALATGRVRQITKTPGVEMDPRVSPDGNWIAYTATTRNVTTIDSVAEDAHVFVVAAAGGQPQELNHALDRRSSAPEWTPDGQGVLYTASDRGKTVLYRVSVKGGASIALIDRKAQAGPYSMARDGLIAIGITDPSMPREVFRFRPDAALQQLTWLNAATVKEWKLATPETITFKSFDNTEVEGWYYPPLNGGKAPASVPLILAIHGGPHGSYGYGFNPAFQIQSAHGYATLAINPRGSSGYGQAFSDGTLLNWGGGDYKDLMAGVDHVLKAKAEIDAQRLGVTGGSYGGFMTNWVITQTKRFKAAVSIASVSNLVSFYATSLYQDLVHA